jgi:hypothetical protein
MKFEEWLNAKRFDGASLGDTQRGTLQAGFNLEEPARPSVVTATADADPIADLRTKTAAEMNRIAASRKAAGLKSPRSPRWLTAADRTRMCVRESLFDNLVEP